MNASQLFELHVMPCLDAGYNLARWLMRDPAAAQDAVQEAALRAFKYIGSARSEHIRPWFLKIVRTTCYDQMRGRADLWELSGQDVEDLEHLQAQAGEFADGPESQLVAKQERERIDAAICSLSPVLREVIVLREIEGLDYAEIAQVADVPIGTVMSRLSRARERLRGLLEAPTARKTP
jgi:RNA polymerase sigma-70 factor (ECF subfamily)